MSRPLLAILALALLLRIIGLSWGLPGGVRPEALHPDEAYALDCLDEIRLSAGDLNPNGAHIEGAFNYYLWWLVTKPAVHAARAVRPLDRRESRAVALVAGRLLTAAFDLCSIALLFVLGREISGNPAPGLVAALLLAVAPGEVILGHYMRAHILANTWTVLALLMGWRILSGALSRRGYALFGAILGLAAATRYPMGLLAILLYLPAFLSRRGRVPASAANVALATLCAAIAFFCGDPYLWLDWSDAATHLERTGTHARWSEFGGWKLLDFGRPWVYLSDLIPHAFTPPLAALVYAALLHRLLLLGRDPAWRWSLTVLLFSGLYVFLMSKGYSEPEFVRAALPLVPVGCLLVALSWDALLRRFDGRGRRLLWIIGGLFVTFEPLRYSLGYDLMMTREDTRLQAGAWVEAHIPSWEKIGLSRPPWFFTPPLGEARAWCLMPAELSGLQTCTVRYWIVDDYEIEREMLDRICRQTPYRVLAEFTCRTAPFGVNLKEGKNLPLDYLYPCLDVTILEWRPR